VDGQILDSFKTRVVAMLEYNQSIDSVCIYTHVRQDGTPWQRPHKGVIGPTR
jgi:hypothetical protein